VSDDVAVLLDQLGRAHRHDLAQLSAQAAALRALAEDAGCAIPSWIYAGEECLRRVRRAFLELEAHGIRDPEQPRELADRWTLFTPGPDPREPSGLRGAEGL
jgi:hypothetical protein